MKVRTHSLASFSAYFNQGFDLRAHARRMRDARTHPEISAVGCQMVHSPVKPFLALDWLRPGKGEETAAPHLLTPLPDLYGSRFFDILLLDALYAQTAVLKLVKKKGWDVVTSLK